MKECINTGAKIQPDGAADFLLRKKFKQDSKVDCITLLSISLLCAPQIRYEEDIEN